MSDWADEIGLDICGPLPHARYVATALRKAHDDALEEAAKILDEYTRAETSLCHITPASDIEDKAAFQRGAFITKNIATAIRALKDSPND